MIQSNTIQSHKIQCDKIQHYTIQYNTIQYNTMQYNTIQYKTIHYNTIQYNPTHLPTHLTLQAHSGSYAGGGQGVGGADLGILKSLSSMSAVAKRNLNNLALQFSKHSGERGETEERGRLVEEQGVSGRTFVPCFAVSYSALQ
jgi:hypothetical protein